MIYIDLHPNFGVCGWGKGGGEALDFKLDKLKS